MSAIAGNMSQLILLSSGVSAGASAGAGIMEAGAARTQGRLDDAFARRNASYLDRQAQDALQRGDIEASRYGSQIRQLQGQQRAAAASQGLVAAPGTSAAQIIEETAKFGALDMMAIRNEAAMRAFGYETEAANLRSQGRMSRRAGKVQRGTTLATGGLRFLAEMGRGKYLSDKAKKPYG